jgi:hypothetical protein
MAILKVGDWVLDNEGKIGVVEQLDWYGDGKASLIWFKGGAFASLRFHESLTPIDPAFHNLLTDVHKEVSDE